MNGNWIKVDSTSTLLMSLMGDRTKMTDFCEFYISDNENT